MNPVTRPRIYTSLAILAGLAAASCGSCTDFPIFGGQSQVFDTPIPSACRTVDVPKKIELQRAADILFVIDNSGSMLEEQDNLARNSSSIGGSGACNTAQAVSDLKAFLTTGPGRGFRPEDWADPANALPNGAMMKAIYDDCGFIERLQLFDNNFQIGVVTTDMRPLDGRGASNTCTAAGGFPGGRMPLPMKGCLVPISGNGGQKIIRPGNIATVSSQFSSLIRNVHVCGSALEEGLRSVKEMLTPDAGRAQAACETDFREFLRDGDCLREADGGCVLDSSGQPVAGPKNKLVVIILSDEEDCSTTNSPDGGPQTDGISGANSAKCYSETQFLKSTSEYVDFLRNIKGDPDLVSVAMIVGGNKTGPGRGDFVAGNCRCNGTVAGGDPILQCEPAQGFSTTESVCGAQEANAFCGTLPQANAMVPAGDGGVRAITCCTADTGSRYVDVARGMNSFILDSICSQNYKSTMIDIANLINEADVVPLGETPQDARQMVVEVKRGEGAEFTAVRPWTGNTSAAEFLACNGCTGNAQQCGSGYALINNCSAVKFLGSDIPPQGSDVRVRFLGAPNTNGPKCQ